jgi:diguanylate cyclase (GGDEF)-like protein/PAS domain S-box-containing protein
LREAARSVTVRSTSRPPESFVSAGSRRQTGVQERTLPMGSSGSRFRSLSDPESLREFARNLREGIYITTRDGRILDANPAFIEMFGLSTLAEMQAFNARDLLADPERRAEQMSTLEKDGSVREFELMLRRPDGETRTVLDTCYLTRDPETNEAFIHGILIDITARKALEARLLEMSTHDALTGALNRRFLLDVEQAFAERPMDRWGCVFVDIDHFKSYNDEFGHQAGDEALVRLARFLMRHVRVEESVIRVGGDEFVVLIKDADATEMETVVGRLREHALEGAPVPFSIGWAAREPGESLPKLLDRADRGLMAVRVIKRQWDPRRRL